MVVVEQIIQRTSVMLSIKVKEVVQVRMVLIVDAQQVVTVEVVNHFQDVLMQVARVVKQQVSTKSMINVMHK